MITDFTKIKFVPIKHKVKDPVRYPKVINVYEDLSKRDFATSIELTLKHLYSEMQNMIR